MMKKVVIAVLAIAGVFLWYTKHLKPAQEREFKAFIARDLGPNSVSYKSISSSLWPYRFTVETLAIKGLLHADKAEVSFTRKRNGYLLEAFMPEIRLDVVNAAASNSGDPSLLFSAMRDYTPRSALKFPLETLMMMGINRIRGEVSLAVAYDARRREYEVAIDIKTTNLGKATVRFVVANGYLHSAFARFDDEGISERLVAWLLSFRGQLKSSITSNEEIASLTEYFIAGGGMPDGAPSAKAVVDFIYGRGQSLTAIGLLKEPKLLEDLAPCTNDVLACVESLRPVFYGTIPQNNIPVNFELNTFTSEE